MDLLVISPAPGDATSFYRCLGPLSQLRRTTNLRPNFVEQVSWELILMYDAVFLQRPCGQVHLEIIREARKQGKPVWIDYDDDYFNTPEHNLASKQYADPLVQETIKECITQATYVTVTTPQLKDLYSPFNPNVHIVPNGLDFDLLGQPQVQSERKKTILWRGGHSHHMDLLSIAT